MRGFVSATLLAAALGSGVAPLHALAQQQTTMATATAVSLLPSRAALDKGYFKAEGLDVNIKLVRGGNDVIQALSAGSIDFGESSHAQFISAVAGNLPIVAIGVNTNGFLGKLIAAQRNAHLTNLADFKGKRIGVQVGTGVHTVLLMALERSGLKPGDFTLSNVRVNDMPAAMQGNEFDAVLAWEPHASRIVQAGRGKEVISSTGFENIAKITYPFLVLTTQKMISERPEQVQKFLNAYAKGQRLIETQRDEAPSIYRKALPTQALASVTDAALSEQIYGATRYDRVVPTDGDLVDLKQTAEFMARGKVINAIPNLDKSLNFGFARKAVASLGK